MNTWRTPQRVVAADCPDQIADVGRDRGPADTTARLPTPIQTQPAPMPAHQRLGLEDNRGFAHGRAQPIEPNEDQAICCAQPQPRWRRPLQDDKLLAEKCCFGLPSRMRSEQSDEQSAEQLQEVKHPKARITHRGICASPDTIFGSHRYSKPILTASPARYSASSPCRRDQRWKSSTIWRHGIRCSSCRPYETATGTGVAVRRERAMPLIQSP